MGVSPVYFCKRTLGWEFYSSCTTKFLTPLKYIFLENSVELEYNIIINAENGSLSYLRFGQQNGGAIYAYHRFTQLPKLGSSPYYVNITNATLKFTFRSGQTSGANGVCLFVGDHQWTESSLTWNNQPYGEWGYTSSHNNYQYYNFYVQPFLEMWYYGGYPNYGIDFTYDTMIADYNSVVSSEGDAARAPKLTIEYSTAKSISYDDTKTGALDLGTCYWYKITPTYSGTHVFYSTGSTDTYGELFQGTTKLKYNDDGGSNLNFRISHNLSAGKTYYLKVRGYNFEKTGNYKVRVLADYTTHLNKLLTDAVELCEEHRCMSWTQYCEWCRDISILITPSTSEHLGMTIGSFTWFYQQVNHGAVWDIKVEARWESALPNAPYLGSKKFLFRGNEMNAADIGNLMYGYTGRATGFGKITLFWGGGVAHQGSINNSEVSTAPYYGDLPEDHEKIDQGYDLFESDYPNYPSVGYNGIPVEQGIIAAIADLLI